MNTSAKLSAYGVALALVATGAWAIGNAVGPSAPAAGEARGGEDAGHGDTHSGTVAETTHNDQQPGGLSSARGGYTLTPTATIIPQGTSRFSFRITGPDGAPVTRYVPEHAKELHLIVVRRDTTGFQHVHPQRAADGTWSVDLNLPAAGSYRAFADFHPEGGESTTLGVDLAVAGEFQPATHVPSRESVVDGYRVTLNGDLHAGKSSLLTATVTKDGKPVTDLQPYLGAYGHLVALRDGDLGYLHVHPEGAPGDGKTPAGPGIGFHVEVPTAGTYRMFLDFQHGGVVRTAEFTIAEGAHE